MSREQIVKALNYVRNNPDKTFKEYSEVFGLSLGKTCAIVQKARREEKMKK